MEPIASHPGFSVSSPAFGDGGFIPPRATCDGEELLPALRLSGVPVGTQSIAIIVDDPDAPSGKWVHWVRFNVDPATAEIPEGGDAGTGLGKGTTGSLGWEGPCPPAGEEHRYYFRAYALSAKLDLPDGVAAEEVEAAMDGLVLAKAALVGRYRRAA